MARDGEAGADTLYPAGLRGDIAKFLSPAGTHAGKPSLRETLGRVLTHTSGLVIGRSARLGSDVNVLHGATIGGCRSWFDSSFEDGLPDIGHGTEIWAGAKVLGPVRVGRRCHKGANAVLTRDLPDGASFTAGQSTRELRHRVAELEAQVQRLQEQLGGPEVRPGPNGSAAG